MKATLNPDGTLTVDLFHDIDRAAITADALMGFADSLACTDAVIKNVADQIVDGITEMDSRAGDDSDAPAPRRALGIARRRVAESASEQAKAQIEKLAAKVVELEATIDRMSSAAQGFRDQYPRAWAAIRAAEFNRSGS